MTTGLGLRSHSVSMKLLGSNQYLSAKERSVMLIPCRLVTVKNCHFGYPPVKTIFGCPSRRRSSKARFTVPSRYPMEPRAVHAEFLPAAPAPVLCRIIRGASSVLHRLGSWMLPCSRRQLRKLREKVLSSHPRGPSGIDRPCLGTAPCGCKTQHESPQ